MSPKRDLEQWLDIQRYKVLDVAPREEVLEDLNSLIEKVDALLAHMKATGIPFSESDSFSREMAEAVVKSRAPIVYVFDRT